MKTVIEMARDQGLPETEVAGVFIVNQDDLSRFAALVRADERNACMKEADMLRNDFFRFLRPPIIVAVGCFLLAYIVGFK